MEQIYGPKKGAAYVAHIALLDSSTGAIKTTPTIASGDFKVSKDGGALSDLDTLPSESPSGSGIVAVTISATEMNADRVTVRWKDASGAEWNDGALTIYTRAVTVDELVRSTTPANTLDVAATGEVGLDFTNTKNPTTDTVLEHVFVDGALACGTVSEIAAEGIDSDSFAAGAVDGDALASTAIAKIWDALTSGLTTSGSIGKKLVDDLNDILAQLGDFSGSDQNTVKGYLLALALSGASKPTDLTTFVGSTDALESIGNQTRGIGYEEGGTGSTKAMTRLYQAASTLSALGTMVFTGDIHLVVDEANSQDEYSITWWSNGRPMTQSYLGALISNCQIRVFKWSDGADLISLTSMTQIGASAVYKYTASGAQRIAAGESYIVEITADYGVSQEMVARRIVSRDSSV